MVARENVAGPGKSNEAAAGEFVARADSYSREEERADRILKIERQMQAGRAAHIGAALAVTLGVWMGGAAHAQAPQSQFPAPARVSRRHSRASACLPSM